MDLSTAHNVASWTAPTASAITQARKRLGRNVFPELFERTCGPVACEACVAAETVALGAAYGSGRGPTAR